jgi:endonuclease/exonuclease/phosphatase family metal-dependent hydrolase
MAERKRAVRLRLATFNLENFGAARDAAPLAERVAALRPQLLRLDADVVCLQEIDPQPPVGAGAKAHPRALRALDQLLADTPYAAFHRAATKNREQSDYADIHNVVLLSRWPFAEVRQLWHELVPEPLWRASTSKPAATEPEPVVWDRPALVARAALPGGRVLHLAAVHLRAPLASPVRGQKLGHEAWRSLGGWAEGYVLSEMKRAGQALEIRLWLDRLFGDEREALVAVMGDLNAEEHHAPLEVILGRDDSIGTGVEAGGALAAGVLVPAERAVAEGRRFTIRHGGRAQMLDHILVSRALAERQRGAEILNESLGDEAALAENARPSPQSFHAPLAAEFDLPD